MTADLVAGIRTDETLPTGIGGCGGSSAAAAINALTRNEQTYGFRYLETHLPLGAAVYALGSLMPPESSLSKQYIVIIVQSV